MQYGYDDLQIGRGSSTQQQQTTPTIIKWTAAVRRRTPNINN